MTRLRDVDLDALLDQSVNGSVSGHDIRTLGPSDSSDTGADMMGLGGLDSTSDRNGTGERASVENDGDSDSELDISVDGIAEAEAAGLGGGLDQAEEARLGVTDEEFEEIVDPRDEGGRNESGQNPDTQIEMGRHMQNEVPAQLRKKFKDSAAGTRPGSK